MHDSFAPTLEAARARLAAVRPATYARTRKVHWRVGADWLYGHLLDGDLASNHLSWQWVAGTGSSKPSLFNAGNVARYAPDSWHSPGSVVDMSHEDLDRMARRPMQQPGRQASRESNAPHACHGLVEPVLGTVPPDDLGLAVNEVPAC